MIALMPHSTAAMAAPNCHLPNSEICWNTWIGSTCTFQPPISAGTT